MTDFPDYAPRLFALPECLSVVEWGERNHVLSARTSSAPGPWSSAVVPYIREPLETFTDLTISTITLLFASQSTKSTAMEIMLGYAAAHAPAPGMWCLPNAKSLKTFVQERLSPNVEASAAWRALLSLEGRAVAEHRINFQSMPLFLALAESEADLASRPCGYVFADEIDKFPENTQKEGAPLDQLRKRMRTFLHGKFVQSSTPTHEYGSIWREYLNSDRREWIVPCLGCGFEEPWTWDHVKWTKPDGIERRKFADMIEAGKAAAEYECPSCGVRAAGEAAKGEMNRRGRWRIGAPGVKNHAGFHLPSLATPWTSFAGLAAEYIRAIDALERGDTRKVQIFVNHELARPYSPKNVRIDAMAIVQRKTQLARGIAPAWVRWIAAGVDVQHNMLYWQIMGGAGGVDEPIRLHVIDWGTVDCPMCNGHELLDAAVTVRELKTETGAARKVQMVFIDMGDYMQAPEVVKYCAARGPQVRGIKGAPNLAANAYFQIPEPERGPDGKPLPLGKDKPITLNVIAIKDFWAAMMQRDPAAPAHVSFADGVDHDAEYQSQMTSEERRRERLPSGHWRVTWTPLPGHENHWFDTAVYCMGGLIILGLGKAAKRAPSREKRTFNPPQYVTDAPFIIGR